MSFVQNYSPNNKDKGSDGVRFGLKIKGNLQQSKGRNNPSLSSTDEWRN